MACGAAMVDEDPGSSIARHCRRAAAAPATHSCSPQGEWCEAGQRRPFTVCPVGTHGIKTRAVTQEEACVSCECQLSIR